MVRQELHRHGSALRAAITGCHRHLKYFYRVTYGDRIVGVGLFHDDNLFCTLAMTLDEQGDTLMFGHFSEDSPIDRFDVARLNMFFEHWQVVDQQPH